MGGTSVVGDPLRDPEHTAAIREMFRRVAPRYRLMNSLMSFGLDRRWRRMAVQQAALPPAGYLLDLATGTGDVAFAALEQDTSLHVIGVDFTPAMMRLGRQHPQGKHVRWCGADVLRLPFPDQRFDAVLSAFLLRNLSPETILDSFREQARVVKPGGRVVCLDAVPPPDNLVRPFVLFYLHRAIPLLGALVAGQRTDYAYLPRSMQSFRSPYELAALMKTAGLIEVRHQTLMLGVIALLAGIRGCANESVRQRR